MNSLMDASPRVDDTRYELALGLEIGDSATRFTLAVGSPPRVRRWYARLSAPATPQEAAETIATLVARALNEHEQILAHSSAHLAVGVALEDAQVDGRQGIVHRLHRAPDWEDSPFAALLGERLRGDADSVRVELASVTDAAAVAEARLGAGQGLGVAEPLLYIRLARGITSSVVIGGHYLVGSHGAQGQIGHIVVEEGGPRCSCGGYGHLEPVASAQSLVRNLIGRASASDESMAAMLRVSGGRAEAMTAAQVVQLASEGDPAASGVLDEALDALAPVLATLSAALAPARLVIGGPLALAAEAFLTPLRVRLAALASPSGVLPELGVGVLEPGTALSGAVLLAAGEVTLH